jgi:hypothetical protein
VDTPKTRIYDLAMQTRALQVRMAYANQHFAINQPGWKTDRGHMYILYGPPDEIDAHPAAKPHPYEQWKYRNTPGLAVNQIVTFVDRTGNGEYRLQSPPWKQPSRKTSTSP